MHDAHRRSLRESWIILAAFGAVTVWVLGVCGMMGYREDRAIRAPMSGVVVPALDRARGVDDRFSRNLQIDVVSQGDVFQRPTGLLIFNAIEERNRLNVHSERIDVPSGYFSNLDLAQPERVPAGSALAAPVEDGPAHLATVLGIPAWAFWGIMAPWVASTLITIWFALRGMADEEMAEAGSDPNDAERTAFPVKPAEPRP